MRTEFKEQDGNYLVVIKTKDNIIISTEDQNEGIHIDLTIDEVKEFINHLYSLIEESVLTIPQKNTVVFTCSGYVFGSSQENKCLHDMIAEGSGTPMVTCNCSKCLPRY